MVWKSWPPKSCASITTRTLGLSLESGDSITSMALKEPGKVVEKRHLPPFAERQGVLPPRQASRCGETVFKLAPSVTSMTA
jgi:hypothetical protein